MTSTDESPVALVTGGSAGLGLALTTALAHGGWRVVSHALRLQGSRSGRLLLRLARPAQRRLLGP